MLFIAVILSNKEEKLLSKEEERINTEETHRDKEKKV